MDKQIIIDGVDVSGCEYYDKNKPSLTCTCEEYSCSECYNCYYKQLKRKEQECNKLYIQLKADEEYHKEEENTLRKIIKNKEERNIELYKENNKLKQTLAEIKEMLKEICMEECSFDWNKTSKKHCGDCDCRYGQILQKIKQEADKVNNG